MEDKVWTVVYFPVDGYTDPIINVRVRYRGSEFATLKCGATAYNEVARFVNEFSEVGHNVTVADVKAWKRESFARGERMGIHSFGVNAPVEAL
jgi:hypothetical protein